MTLQNKSHPNYAAQMNILKRNGLSSEFNAKAEDSTAPLNELMTWLIFENGADDSPDEITKKPEGEAEAKQD